MTRGVKRTSVVLVGLLALAGCGSDGGRPDAPAQDREAGDLCEESTNPNWDERPLWGQVVEGNGLPDYANPSRNINVGQSIRLFASLLQVVTNRMRDAGEAARSECICEGDVNADCTDGNSCEDALNGTLNAFDDDAGLPNPDAFPEGAFDSTGVRKENCEQYCEALEENGLCAATGDVTTWRNNDLLVSPTGFALKALTHVDWLDGFWNKVRSPEFQDKIEANQNTVDSLNEAASGIDGVLGKVDQFTEGHHIGGYSVERPDLWFCVPRAGGNIYAPLFELLDGKISVGSRWRSGLAAKKIRSQFGWTTPEVRAFGVNIPLGINLNLNTQIDAFKLWNRERLLGLPVGTSGLDVSSVANVASYDALNIVEGDTWLPLLQDIAGPDGTLSATDLLYDSYYPVRYSPDGDEILEWPRLDDDGAPENVSTAVVGAGVNWEHDFGDLLESQGDDDTNPIEGTQKLLDKIKTPRNLGSSNFGITPYVKLGLRLELYNEASRLLDQIRDKINQNLPVSEQLEPEELTRDREAWMQAPDVSRDLGLEGTVSPELGVQIGGSIEVPLVTVRANAGLGVRAALTPGFAGDTVDINRAVADRMDDFGPTGGECTPVFPTTHECHCSANTIPESTGNYGCYLSVEDTGVDALTNAADQPTPVPALAVNQCDAYGTCIVGGVTSEDVRETNCDGEYIPYRNIDVTVPNLYAEPQWEGDCHPLISGFEASEAEQLVEDIRSAPDLHSIFTYAASTIRLVAMLTGFIDARVEISAPFKIFGKRPKIGFNLHYDFATDLGSTADVNFVKGLEADYESACNGDVEFTLHESKSNFALNNDVENGAYEDWCFSNLDYDSTYNDVPEQNEDTLAETINGFSTLGSEAVTNLWSANELCVAGEPLLEVLQAPEHWTGMTCNIAGDTEVFDCGDLASIAIAGSCAAPNATLGQLCGGAGCNIEGGQVDIDSLPDTIPAEYEAGVEAWFDDVTRCVEDLDIEISEEERELFAEAVPCCGDGQIQGSEAEEVGGCDDGNLIDGDGCSSSCRQEAGYVPVDPNDCDLCEEGEIRPINYECQGDHASVFVQEECRGCEWVEFEEVEWCAIDEYCDPDTSGCEPCEDDVGPACIPQ